MQGQKRSGDTPLSIQMYSGARKRYLSGKFDDINEVTKNHTAHFLFCFRGYQNLHFCKNSVSIICC